MKKFKAIDIDNLTLRQLKEITAIAGGVQDDKKNNIGADLMNAKVIVRTYSAGVWFGELSERAGDEVILSRARRMSNWLATESISLSACAIHGINPIKSKICEPVESIWLQAIEIIPCTAKAIKSIEGAENAKAE